MASPFQRFVQKYRKELRQAHDTVEVTVRHSEGS